MTLTRSEIVDLVTAVYSAIEEAESQARLSKAVEIDPKYWEKKTSRYRALYQKLMKEPCELT